MTEPIPRCPNCRTPYSPEKYVTLPQPSYFVTWSFFPYLLRKKKKKRKSKNKLNSSSESCSSPALSKANKEEVVGIHSEEVQRELENTRVIQRTLVYIANLPVSVAGATALLHIVFILPLRVLTNFAIF